jgi:phospho-N-acetylmuramoyl-pentapeptide-transferase
MLYYLFLWLDKHFNVPGAGVFQYISFRTAMAVLMSLVITTVYGNRLISYLRAKQVGETVRNLGLEGQMQKQGTPTMGGIIILMGILIPTLLFARLENIYIILMLITTVWMGVIGFIDDYIKVFKKDKEGLAGRFKIMGQVGLALIIGWTMYYNPNIVVRQRVTLPTASVAPLEVQKR